MLVSFFVKSNKSTTRITIFNKMVRVPIPQKKPITISDSNSEKNSLTKKSDLNQCDYFI
jgi:hypothetical protein